MEQSEMDHAEIFPRFSLINWLLCLFLFCYISILHKQEMRKVNPMRLLVFLPGPARSWLCLFAKPLLGVAAKCGLCVAISFAEKPNAQKKQTNKSLPKHDNTHRKRPAKQMTNSSQQMNKQPSKDPTKHSRYSQVKSAQVSPSQPESAPWSYNWTH